MRKLIAACMLIGVALAPLMWSVATTAQPAAGLVYQYAVKVVQGKTAGYWDTPSPRDPLSAGLYCTSVNIHNPWERDVSYRYKLAISAHDGDHPNIITGYAWAALPPDGAAQYDGEDFDTLLASVGGAPDFFEGYFVIECDWELDVVGVYTGSHLEDRQLETMEIERVVARPLCQDVRLSLATGVADWWLTTVPSTSTLVTGVAPVSLPRLSVWATPTQSGAQWVGTRDTPGQDTTAVGQYTYTLSFCLCRGFRNAQMELDLWADNRAELFFNGISLGFTTGYSDPLVTEAFHTGDVRHFSIPNGAFLVGTNTLTVVVGNDPLASSPTTPTASGMLLQGWLFAEAGVCP
jgi:hypothetical protein